MGIILGDLNNRLFGCEDWLIWRVQIEEDGYRNQSMREVLGIMRVEWDVRPCGHLSPIPWKSNLRSSSVAAMLKAMGSSGSAAWRYWLADMTV